MVDNKLCKILSFFEYFFAFLIILFGFYLRYKAYSANLSFWVDEEAVLLNSQNIFEGIEPFWHGLKSEHLSPFLLLLGRLVYKNFSYNEMAFRIIPLTASIITLPLFFLLLKKIVKTKFIALIPLLFVSINSVVIFYSQYFKFYISDFLWSVLIAIFIFNIKSLTIRNTVLYAVIAFILSWFGHSPIFYLSGISLCILIKLLFSKNDREIWIKYLIFCIPWFSAACFYFYQVVNNKTEYREYLYKYWNNFVGGNFAPQNINDIENLIFYHTGSYTDYHTVVLWFIIALSGLFIMLKRDNLKTLCFISPIFIMLIFAYLGVFPFLERQTLYLMPIWLIVSTKSIDFIDWKSLNQYLVVIPVICFCMLFYIFKNYDISYVNDIIYNPNYFRMSTAKEFYPFLIKDYKPDGHHLIYSCGRDASLRIYDVFNKIINFDDAEEINDFDTFINNPKADNKIIHIYLMDYPFIGTKSSEIYAYIQKNCVIIKEISDDKGKYLMFRKK